MSQKWTNGTLESVQNLSGNHSPISSIKYAWPLLKLTIIPIWFALLFLPHVNGVQENSEGAQRLAERPPNIMQRR